MATDTSTTPTTTPTTTPQIPVTAVYNVADPPTTSFTFPWTQPPLQIVMSAPSIGEAHKIQELTKRVEILEQERKELIKVHQEQLEKLRDDLNLEKSKLIDEYRKQIDEKDKKITDLNNQVTSLQSKVNRLEQSFLGFTKQEMKQKNIHASFLLVEAYQRLMRAARCVIANGGKKSSKELGLRLKVDYPDAASIVNAAADPSRQPAWTQFLQKTGLDNDKAFLDLESLLEGIIDQRNDDAHPWISFQREPLKSPSDLTNDIRHVYENIGADLSVEGFVDAVEQSCRFIGVTWQLMASFK